LIWTLQMLEGLVELIEGAEWFKVAQLAKEIKAA